MNSWLHPLKHNKEQRQVARVKNLEASRITAERVRHLRECGYHDEAAKEQPFVNWWANVDPGFFYPWDRA